MLRKNNRFALVLIVLLAFFSGCLAESPGPYERGGKVYGTVKGSFRNRWWNYYARGLSFAEGGFYTQAIPDIKEAIRQRGADQRMARTYGMHFIDYFPHRELGVIYYRLGKISASREELELSLKQFSSAKAEYYLDKVRWARLKKGGKSFKPPEVTLDAIGNEIWTRKDPVRVSGTAQDPNFITNVRINNRPVFMALSQKRIPFNEPLVLSQGDHDIAIKVRSLTGRITEKKLMIHVDRQGPTITLDKVGRIDSGGRFRMAVAGSVYDRAGVRSLTIGGKKVVTGGRKEVFFNDTLSVHQGFFEIRSMDTLGNQTRAEVPAFELSVKMPDSIRVASADNRLQGLMTVAGLFGTRDETPPVITLKGWTRGLTVFLDKIYLEGSVADDSGVKQLTVNHQPILRREGKSIFFSHMAALREGENTIVIEAGDGAGNMCTRKIRVKRRIPAALTLEERLSITVLPFGHDGTAVSSSASSFQENLTAFLVNQHRFRVIEREKLDRILQEQKLSTTDLIDPDTALELGKLIAAQSIVTGRLIETASGIEIVARIIDTQTGEILAMKDVYDETKSMAGLKRLAQGMSVKFNIEFPLLEGLVIQRKGKQIFTDLGRGKAKIPRRVIIFREEPILHPLTGKKMGADNIILGRARISQVMADMSKAAITSGNIDQINPLNKVITE